MSLQPDDAKPVLKNGGIAPGGASSTMEIAAELLSGGEGVTAVVAKTLRESKQEWTPVDLATLMVQLGGALRGAAVNDEERARVVPMLAGILHELSKEWEYCKVALVVDLLAMDHGWGRGGKRIGDLLLALSQEKGLVLGSIEWVEEAAALTAALRQFPFRWEAEESCGLLGVLLPVEGWDPSGMRACTPGGATALLLTALTREWAWPWAEAAALLQPLLPSWDAGAATALAAELRGNFAWNLDDIAGVLRVVLGWEASAAESAVWLIDRLSGERYEWMVEEVGELVSAMRESESGEEEAWDAGEVSVVATQLWEKHGWEVQQLEELIGALPLAWDLQSLADLVGPLPCPLEDAAELVRGLLEVDGRSAEEVAGFMNALRLKHEWPTADIVELLQACLSARSPYKQSAGLSLRADLSSRLEACKEAQWSPEDLAEVLCGLEPGADAAHADT